MNPNLSHAILEFLANEFHQDLDTMDEDTDFAIDLNLTPDQITDLLGRIQDALDFTLPVERMSEISRVGDIIRLLESESSETGPVNPE